jgi:5,10-methylenetetrahydrofolate reductase
MLVRETSTWSARYAKNWLASGAPGLHFYTLNQAALTTALWQRLKLS